MSFDELKNILMLEKPGVVLVYKKDELANLIPEFSKTYNFTQQNDWNIYDVFTHTLRVIDETPAILPLRIASLFHDIGKPDTVMVDEDGVYHFPNHATISELIFSKYAAKFNITREDITLIKKLILFHNIKLSTNTYDVQEMIDNFDGNINLLFTLKEADVLGHSPKYYDSSMKELDKLKKVYLRQKILKK